MENVMAVKSWIRLVPIYILNGILTGLAILAQLIYDRQTHTQTMEQCQQYAASYALHKDTA